MLREPHPAAPSSIVSNAMVQVMPASPTQLRWTLAHTGRHALTQGSLSNAMVQVTHPLRDCTPGCTSKNPSPLPLFNAEEGNHSSSCSESVLPQRQSVLGLLVLGTTQAVSSRLCAGRLRLAHPHNPFLIYFFVPVSLFPTGTWCLSALRRWCRGRLRGGSSIARSEGCGAGATAGL